MNVIVVFWIVMLNLVIRINIIGDQCLRHLHLTFSSLYFLCLFIYSFISHWKWKRIWNDMNVLKAKFCEKKNHWPDFAKFRFILRRKKNVYCQIYCDYLESFISVEIIDKFYLLSFFFIRSEMVTNYWEHIVAA